MPHCLKKVQFQSCWWLCLSQQEVSSSFLAYHLIISNHFSIVPTIIIKIRQGEALRPKQSQPQASLCKPIHNNKNIIVSAKRCNDNTPTINSISATSTVESIIRWRTQRAFFDKPNASLLYFEEFYVGGNCFRLFLYQSS